MKKNILLLHAILLLGISAHAQAPSLYNIISGVVWVDKDSNNTRNIGEQLVPGILVTLMNSNDSALSSALSDANGRFTLPNYAGTGTYYINYVFPSAGYNVVLARAGLIDSISCAADSNTVNSSFTGFGSALNDAFTVSTPTFTISNNTNLNSYGLGLHRLPTTLTYWSYQSMTPTNWNRTFKLPKSNNNIAIASRGAILVNSAVFHPAIGIENTSTSSPDTPFVTAQGFLAMTLPVSSIPSISSSAKKSKALATYDGTVNYSGTSGYTWDSSYAAAHTTANISGSTNLAFYQTTLPPDSVSISASATTGYSIVSAGNVVASVSTRSGAGVFITYTYPTFVSLPITLISFSAARNGNTAMLRWTATSNAAGDGFVIEHSIDGIYFAEIGRVPAANSLSRENTNYQFTDAVPAPSTNLYRLKMTSNDGTLAYSSVATVSFDKISGAATPAFPNPAVSTLTVTADADSRIVLLNAMGQPMNTNVAREAGKAVLDVALLPAGIYTLRIQDAGSAMPRTERIVIERP